MADESDNANPDPNATTAAPQAPATSAPQIVSMTVEELEAKINAAAAAARRAEQAKQKQPEPPKAQPKSNDTSPANTGQPTDDVLSMLRRQSAFDRAVGKANLSDEQVSILETLLQVAPVKPEEVGAWVAAKAKAFGTTQNPNPNPTLAPSAPAHAAPTAAPTTPAPSHPAPAATNPVAPPQSITDWNSDQLRAYMRSKGANPANPYSPEYRKVARELRNRFLADTADMKLVGPK